MLPVCEFYLKGYASAFGCDATGVEAARGYRKPGYPPPPDVHFICTKTLADDFNKIIQQLHLPEKMEAHEDIHTSSSNSNAAALGGGEGVDSRLVPTEVNKAWVEEMYGETLDCTRSIALLEWEPLRCHIDGVLLCYPGSRLLL